MHQVASLHGGYFLLPEIFQMSDVVLQYHRLIQIRLRNLAREALKAGHTLPPAAHRLFAIWFASGVPAFLAVLTILWLMLARPEIAL